MYHLLSSCQRRIQKIETLYGTKDNEPKTRVSAYRDKLEPRTSD